MNVKQLTYTALSQGWDIERTLGSPDSTECAEFSSVSAQSSTDAALYAYAFSKGVGILYRSVPYGVDVVGRRRFYSHGYVFSNVDCDRMFENHADLLSVDYFADGQSAELRDFNELTRPFNHKFEGKVAAILAEAIYECLLDNKIMEIYHVTDEKEKLIRAVMNTIFDFLPVKLKKFATFSSAHIGSISKVTVTDAPCGYADIKYDLNTNNCEGLSGKYKSFIKALFTDDKNLYLAELENAMGHEFVSDINMCSGAIQTAISDLVFRAEAKKPIDLDNVRVALEQVLGRRQFDNSVDIEFMTTIFTKLFDAKTTVDGIFDSELVMVYTSTSSIKLKKALVNYLALLYYRDIPTLFDKVLASKNLSNDVYIELTRFFLIIKNDTFMTRCAEYAMDNPEYCAFIVESCGDKAALALSSAIADTIAQKGADRKFFAALIKLPIHKYVIKLLLKSDMSADTFWNYLCTVYSSPDNMAEYRTLGPLAIKACDNFFFTELPLREKEAVDLLGNSYTPDSSEYKQIEKTLVSLGYKTLLSRLYAEKFSLLCTCCEDFEAQKKHLAKLDIDTYEYVFAVVRRYSDLCLKKHEKSHLSRQFLIEKILNFAEGVTIDDIPEIKAAKTEFWNKFNFKKFAFTDKFAEEAFIMSLPDNEKSRFATALFSLYNCMKENRPINDAEYKTCLSALCMPNKSLSASVQESIIKELSAAYKESLKSKNGKKKSPTMEITLLLNYSPKKRCVKKSNAALPLDILCKYITENADNEFSILQIPAVAKSLLEHLERAESVYKSAAPLDASKAYNVLNLIIKKNSFRIKVKNYFSARHLGYAALLLAVVCLMSHVLFPMSYLAPLLGYALSISFLLVLADTYDPDYLSFGKTIFACILAILCELFMCYF